jgi:hypothetical protein
LFNAPSGDELENRYRQIAGDGFTSIDPTFAAVFNSVSNAVLSDDARRAREICDSSVWESMDLDDVRPFAPPSSPFNADTARLVCTDHHRVPVSPHRDLLPIGRLVRVLPHLFEYHRLAASVGRFRLEC